MSQIEKSKGFQAWKKCEHFKLYLQVMIRHIRDNEIDHFFNNTKHIDQIVDQDPSIKADKLFLPFLNERDGLGRLIKNKSNLLKEEVRIESLPTESQKPDIFHSPKPGYHSKIHSLTPLNVNSLELDTNLTSTPTNMESQLNQWLSIHSARVHNKTNRKSLVKPLPKIVPPIGYYNHIEAFNKVSPRSKIAFFPKENKKSMDLRLKTPPKREIQEPSHNEREKMKISPRRAQWQIEYLKLMNDKSIKLQLQPHQSITNEVNKKQFFNKINSQQLGIHEYKNINNHYVDIKMRIVNLKKSIFDENPKYNIRQYSYDD